MIAHRTAKRLVIFEGPDGAGKTTLAKAVAEHLDAHYVHLGPFRRVAFGSGLARLYAEAMMPAAIGDRAVVMDRSWISEKPYADAFRAGRDRLSDGSKRSLERLAWRCMTTVVFCLPPWDRVGTNFMVTRGDQMLDNLAQLRQVYDAFSNFDSLTSLPRCVVDPLSYGRGDPLAVREALSYSASTPHRLDPFTSGNVRGARALVVASHEDWSGSMPLHRWAGVSVPFAVASALLSSGTSEALLMWAPSDGLTDAIRSHPLPVISADAGADSALADKSVVPALSFAGLPGREFEAAVQELKKVVYA